MAARQADVVECHFVLCMPWQKKNSGGGDGPGVPPPGYATGAVCKEFFFVILNSGILCAKTMMILLFLTSWDAL